MSYDYDAEERDEEIGRVIEREREGEGEKREREGELL